MRTIRFCRRTLDSLRSDEAHCSRLASWTLRRNASSSSVHVLSESVGRKNRVMAAASSSGQENGIKGQRSIISPGWKPRPAANTPQLSLFEHRTSKPQLAL
eukprot:gnl/MRDRNA2_/MRDRNA2_71247_c0_seq1.p2 gnl/MRDRNA2_/MRDRNA2_71247_c0~~gnl/MRDRNA2_/MRDRNA2_71247_c0_seq1.p2  ORF type:complete len:101 (+),score=10.97 gnl/MRDRNA2_/MRDRNA2_71247_c0_seq1:1019-1321(+)